jgi:transposase
VCGGKPDAPGIQEPVSGRVLSQRVGWLAGLVQAMADEIITAHWSAADLARLAGGVGPDGRGLPGNGWMALRRLGWGGMPPPGVVVSDRVRRIAEEEAARALRLAVHRRAIVAALLASWPTDPFARTDDEWSALRAVLPDGTDNATIRNRTRQIVAFVTEHGRVPADLCELEQPPTVARQVSLAAADRQQVVVERVDNTTVRVWTQLPLCMAPASYRDWMWHALDVVLPPTVPAGVKVCTPTLRPRLGKVRVDVPWQIPHTPPALAGHTRALGVDWGLNTLLTVTVADIDATGIDATGIDTAGVVTADGLPLRFDATGVSAKLVRLRRHRELLKSKIDHLTRLRDGRCVQAVSDPALTAKLARLEAEHTAVCARIRHLNNALAWSAARWLVDHAAAVNATVIYVENLATLEARGGSRSLNRRLSGTVRGSVHAATAHLAAKAGIAVVSVPARGTSSGCPRCGGGVKHVKAPDRPVAGYRWTVCECGLSTDRDHAAAERIAARGLASQSKARRDRNGNAAIRAAADVPVGRRKRRSMRPVVATPRPVQDHRKTGPTPKQVRPATVKTSPLLPLRRQAPAPADFPQGAVGQRPAGRTPQDAYPVLQVPHTVSTSTPRQPHRVRGAILGRGFHRHVHATPVPGREGSAGEMSDLQKIA